MPARVRRCGFWFALACICAACTHAADTPVRSAPSRPGAGKPAAAPATVRKAPAAAPAVSVPPAPPPRAVASRKINGVDYVSLANVASHLGIQRTVQDRGETVLLTGKGTRAEIKGGTRDVDVNGLRLFLGHPSVIYRGQVYVSRIDFETSLAPLLRPGHGVSPIKAPKTIVLDPGHGGRDHGKINEDLKINEKTFTLDVAKRLKSRLEADGYRVILTRDGDTYPELAERPAIANREDADLFISIHFNALSNDRKTSGFEVYTFPPQHQRSTNAWMPGKNDDTETTRAPSNQFDYWSSLLAHSLQRPFVKELNASDRGKKIMHLAVLRSLQCPGVLIECGFLSSDLEAKKIMNAWYRQQIADALRDGIADYAAAVAQARKAATKPR